MAQEPDSCVPQPPCCCSPPLSFPSLPPPVPARKSPGVARIAGQIAGKIDARTVGRTGARIVRKIARHTAREAETPMRGELRDLQAPRRAADPGPPPVHLPPLVAAERIGGKIDVQTGGKTGAGAA